MHRGRLFTVTYSETLSCFTNILICVKHITVLFATTIAAAWAHYYQLQTVNAVSSLSLFRFRPCHI